jgi:hypothetical protein
MDKQSLEDAVSTAPLRQFDYDSMTLLVVSFALLKALREPCQTQRSRKWKPLSPP